MTKFEKLVLRSLRLIMVGFLHSTGLPRIAHKKLDDEIEAVLKGDG